MKKKTATERCYWKNRLALDIECMAIDELANTLLDPVSKGLTYAEISSEITNVINSGPRDTLTRKQERALTMLFNCLKVVWHNKLDMSCRMSYLLDCAVVYENLALVKLLLSFGAKPKKSTMEAASEYSSSLKKVLDILETLLEAGGKIQHTLFKHEFECLSKLSKTKMAKMTPREVVKYIEAHLLAQELERN